MKKEIQQFLPLALEGIQKDSASINRLWLKSGRDRPLSRMIEWSKNSLA